MEQNSLINQLSIFIVLWLAFILSGEEGTKCFGVPVSADNVFLLHPEKKWRECACVLSDKTWLL